MKPSSPSARVLAAATVFTTLLATAWSALPAPAVAPAAGAAAGEVTEAPDEATAFAAAKRTGQQVEIAEERTQTSRLFATPQGTMMLEQHAMPVRVKKNHQWVPIDTTLVRTATGTVAPAAVTVDLEFSGGGSGPLASIARDGRALSMSWPGTLPAPVLEGDTAIYGEVLPGVDLRVRATTDGFAQLLVVKDRRAAATLRRITYGLAAKGLSVRAGADGSTTAVDEQGNVHFSSGTPLMWDTQQQAQEAGLASASGPAGPNQKAMGLEVAAGSLTVIPDPGLMESGNYPLYLDPSYSAAAAAWTYVNKQSPGTSYWTTKESTRAKVGKVWGVTDGPYRSIFQMNMSRIANSTVKRAWFYIVMDHSADCALGPVELWHTAAVNPATALTWNSTNTTSFWLRNVITVQGRANEGTACPAPDDPMEFENATFKTIVQDIATRGLPTVTVGLRIPVGVETSQYHWKYFHPSSARVNVEFNTRPDVPSGLTTVPATGCGTATAPTAINTSTPMFSAVPSDRDSHNLVTDLEILQGETVVASVRSGTSGSGAAISWPQLTWGILPEDQPTTVYSYRARSHDVPPDPVDTLPGLYTPRCYFTVDRLAPAPGTFGSTDFPDGVAVRAVGETGTVTFTKAASDTDVAGFRYGFSRESITLFAPVTANGTATVPITLWRRDPGDPSSIARTLFMRVVDRAGNQSGTMGPWTLNATDRAVTAPPVRGDTNGDRRADVTSLVDQGNGGTVAWNFVSTGTSARGYVGWDAGGAGGFPSYRVVSAVAEVDGDGRSDVVAFREDPDRTISLFILRSDGTRFDAGLAAWTGTTFRLSHMKIVPGDFDGDGDDDIAVFQGYPSLQTKLFVLWSNAGTFGAPVQFWDGGLNNWDVSRSRYATGDFDADGDDDIAGFYGYVGNQTKLWVWSSNRTSFAAPAMLWDSGAGAFDIDQATFASGNLDGDTAGRDEIVARYNAGASTTRLVGFTPGAPWTQRVWWDSGAGALDAAKSTLATGDYNADGKADAAILYDIGGGARRLYTYASNGTAFAAPRTDWEGNVGAAAPTLFVEPGRKYKLHPTHSDKCAEIAGNVLTDGAALQQWSCTAGTNQQYLVERIGASPYFHLKVVRSSKCLDVLSWSVAENAKVQQWTCANVGASQPNQQFRLDYVEGAGLDVVVQPVIVHSGKCLNTTGGGTADGATIVQVTCTSAAHQRFFLRLEP
ncbi:MAG TPA: RICIN domain-containing protein [Candidatus Limnocylindrales bacterium]